MARKLPWLILALILMAAVLLSACPGKRSGSGGSSAAPAAPRSYRY